VSVLRACSFFEASGEPVPGSPKHNPDKKAQ
jgi:hypothetical protein